MDAHYAARQTYDYFWTQHGRQGMDGSGGYRAWEMGHLEGTEGQKYTIGVVIVTDSQACASTNASHTYWGNRFVHVSDGDAAGGPSTTLDLIGHEWTHGIAEEEDAFWNADEPGVLRESWCDVFGELIDRTSNPDPGDDAWKIGAILYGPIDAWRYMDRPHSGANDGMTPDDSPDHYSERYVGTYDNGGVHYNSGIANLAFKLLAEGGEEPLGAHPCPYQNRGRMLGHIGLSPAAQVWYRALTLYIGWGTTFADARAATRLAAEDLFPSPSAQYVAVGRAWTLAGVGLSSGNIETVAGSGTAGYAGDEAQAELAQLNLPTAVAVDRMQTLYIADTSNNRVRRVVQGWRTDAPPDGTIQTLLSDVSAPTDLALDEERNYLYVAESGAHSITTVIGNGTCAWNGDGAPTATRICSPSRMAGYYDFYRIYPSNPAHPEQATFLYFTDPGNHVIRRATLDVSQSAPVVQTLSGTGETAGYYGDQGVATSALLNGPKGVALDLLRGTDGIPIGIRNVFVADTGNHVVRRLVN